MYQPNEIEDFASQWRSAYQENDDRGESCIQYAFGEQWDCGNIEERALRGEESLVFNLMQKYLMHVKGEAEGIHLSLIIKNKNSNPELLREGIHVLDRVVLCNENLFAFKKAIGQVYDYGYSAMLVTTKRCNTTTPDEEPFLQVLNEPKKVFFDATSQDEFKTEGRFCGIMYTVPKKEIGEEKRCNREEDCSDVIDFWYREPFEEVWWLDNNGEYTKEEPSSFLVKRKIQNHKVKFMRIVDGKIAQRPVDYYTLSKLPIIYWRGNEVPIRHSFRNKQIKTIPYIYNLVDCQAFLNYTGSSIVGRLKKLGGTKVIVTDQMVEGKENSWAEFNRKTGVLQINESDDGTMQQPMVLPQEVFDGTLLNAMQSCMQLMDQLSGITQAQQGQQQAPTSAGLHRQIMQGNIVQNVILSNHLRSINEVGRILKEMVPNVLVTQMDLGEGLEINKKGEMHTPSSPQVKNDIRELFSKISFSIEYGASSDAQKAANLMAIKEVIQTNPQLAPYLMDEFAENLDTSNSEKLKRRLEALMPQGIKDVGDGILTSEEFRAQQQAQQQAKGQQPSFPEQQLQLQKQKIEGDQQIKQAELQLKAQKLQGQQQKDQKNLQIKEVGAISKLKGS